VGDAHEFMTALIIVILVLSLLDLIDLQIVDVEFCLCHLMDMISVHGSLACYFSSLCKSFCCWTERNLTFPSIAQSPF
jgi:hypothetical protein